MVVGEVVAIVFTELWQEKAKMLTVLTTKLVWVVIAEYAEHNIRLQFSRSYLQIIFFRSASMFKM